MKITELNSINEWADFWRLDIGVNVIPADTRRKVTYESWAEWQNKPIPQELYSEWKASGAFNNGIAIILGKVWHNPNKTDLYLIGIDLDNQKAIEEICNRNDRTMNIITVITMDLSGATPRRLNEGSCFIICSTNHFQKRAVTIITLSDKT